MQFFDEHIVSAENSKLNVIWQHSMDFSTYSSTTWSLVENVRRYIFDQRNFYREHLSQHEQIALYCIWPSSDHQDETEEFYVYNDCLDVLIRFVDCYLCHARER